MSEEKPFVMQDANAPGEVLDALTQWTGVAVPEPYRDAVYGHFQAASRMAQLLFDAPVADASIESAAVFCPQDSEHSDSAEQQP